MTPERHAQIGRLYHQALALSLDDRTRFLDAACGGDHALQQEVLSLLSAYDRASDFIETPAAASVATEAPALSIGDQLNSYRITGRLGAGGMGEVFRARDMRLGREVAIKILPRAFTTRPERLARFEREARVLAALNHPNIGAIYGVEQTTHGWALVLELVDGDTLAEVIARGRLPPARALRIALQIADALAAAHHKGIVHRDLKPQNIALTRDGAVKVLDFGIAKANVRHDAPFEYSSGPTITEGGTREGVIVGTPAYMSPEQARGQAVDERTDAWAFGCVLYEMLAGRTVFGGVTISDTIAGVLERDPDWSALPRATPRRVRRLIEACLAKDPAQRAGALGDARQVLAQTTSDRTRLLPRYPAVAALTVATAAVVGGLVYWRSERQRWVHEQAAPQIARLAAEERSAAAFPVWERAQRILPDDPDLVRAIRAATSVVSIASTPPGAVVEVKDYVAPDEPWVRLGVTPLHNTRVPSGYLRWRVSKAGVGESLTAPPTTTAMTFDLESAARAPSGMVPVPAGVALDYLAFIGMLGPYPLPAFSVDRLEVTNREYQEFIDKGGYTNRAYWKEPFVENGRMLDWTEAIARFRDPTGRPGPSTWDGGHYPKGTADYPVTGVSWYEAAAYAEFVGKSLPVIAQAVKLAPAAVDRFALPLSNSSSTLAPAGKYQALGPYGTYDMLGNAREWTRNSTGTGLWFMLGRQAASYGPEALPPFDRSPLNGFRCVRNTAPLPDATTAARPLFRRDFSKVTPVDDRVFRVYRNMFAYDKTPLHATLEGAPQVTDDWTKQKVSFDAAYQGERVPAFLFLPKHARPPYQVVVFFPSARVDWLPSSDQLDDLTFMDYVVKSGRAVLYPIYKNLYERHPPTPASFGGMMVREVVVDWSKDLGRSIDYLETRPDIDASKIGYLGVSQGSADGVILTTVEDRIKVVVLLDGGYFQNEHPVPGMDQADYAPRLTKPVLMVNGRYDATFPFETAQEPLFRMLGTPAADKRHVVFDTPHDVRLRRADLVTTVLAWLDKYLGPVR